VPHLSLDQLGKLREGALAASELLDADDHLSECEECRARLATLPMVGPAWAEMIGGLRAAAEAAEPHLSYERLQAYVDGKSTDADRALLEAHLSECEVCRADAEDLKEFASAYEARNRRPARYARYLIFGPIAATLLLAALLLRPHPQAVPLAASLEDSGKTIGLDQGGHLVGAEVAGSAGRDLLLAVLRDHRMVVTIPEGLRSHVSVLLGVDSGETHFRVLNPVGEPVLKDEPEFRWEPLDKARGYTVQIFDADYQPVASSSTITGTSWTPEHPLDRGKQYVWQVTALRNGVPVKSPRPPDAEARFVVVTNGDATAIEQAHQAQAGHLQMAALYAHAGLCHEALTEMEALERENSGSALVQQLLADLANQCDAGPGH